MEKVRIGDAVSWYAANGKQYGRVLDIYNSSTRIPAADEEAGNSQAVLVRMEDGTKVLKLTGEVQELSENTYF